MNIVFFDQSHFPIDKNIRLDKIIHTLRPVADKLRVICKHEAGKPKYEQLDEQLEVYRWASYPEDSLTRYLSMPSPLNPIWMKRVTRLLRDRPTDLLVGTSLRSVFPAIAAGRKLNLPVAFDMAEYFPGMGQLFARGLVERMIKNPTFVSYLEHRAVTAVDHTWVVVDEQRRRMLAKGIPPERLSVVSNVPVLSGSLPKPPEFTFTDDQPLKLVYAGEISEGRGLRLILHALDIMRKNGSEIVPHFTVIGDGPDRLPLEQIASQLGLSEHVEFRGWVPRAEVNDHVRQCHVGVIPHVLCDFTHHTIPNKIFDYMQQGIGVLATAMKPVDAVIQECKCGVSVPEEPLAVADELTQIRQQPGILTEWGKNGQAAIRDRYNWQIASEEILAVVRRLTSRSNT